MVLVCIFSGAASAGGVGDAGESLDLHERWDAKGSTSQVAVNVAARCIILELRDVGTEGRTCIISAWASASFVSLLHEEHEVHLSHIEKGTCLHLASLILDPCFYFLREYQDCS